MNFGSHKHDPRKTLDSRHGSSPFNPSSNCEILYTLGHQNNQRRSGEFSILLPDHLKGKDQGLITITEETSLPANPRQEVKRSGESRLVQRTRTPNHVKDHPRTGIDHFAWSHSRSSKAVPVQKTGTSQDPRPPSRMDLAIYQPVVSQLKKWGISNMRRPPLKSYRTYMGQRVPCQRRTKIPSQARVLQTWSLRWMNATTHLMTVLSVGTEIHTVDFRINWETRKTLISQRSQISARANDK